MHAAPGCDASVKQQYPVIQLALYPVLEGDIAAYEVKDASLSLQVGCERPLQNTMRAKSAVYMQFRQALSRPMPAERDYLEAQFTGVGVLIGQHKTR